jgi:hypothetical protein
MTDDEAGTADDAIRAVVGRLARPHRSGGVTIERAAILAEGADCSAVVAWITAHDGQPEAAISSAKGGLHAPRLSDQSANSRFPARYVLPSHVLHDSAGGRQRPDQDSNLGPTP